MRLVESVQDVTLDGLRRFIEQAERSGARGDTPVAMTRARNGGVLTLAVDFEPRSGIDDAALRIGPTPLPPGTYTKDPENDVATEGRS